MGDDEVGEVGGLLGISRKASTEPWKHPTRYISEPMIRNLASRSRPNSCHLPVIVPKKFTSTVHTGMMRSIEVMMASVSAQSAIGL